LRTYWDTSAIINAFFTPDVFKRLDKGEHFTRLHSFAEFFCTMTGRGIPTLDQDGNAARMKLSGNDCAMWLRTFATKVHIIEPDKNDVLEALDKAQRKNIQGGKVYDYLHALASTKAKADELLTRNTDDFKGLAENAKWP
jgi:predicted nucleic acid-binding protein